MSLDVDDVLSAGPARYWDFATITVGELVDDGILTYEWFDFDAFDEEQRERLWAKFKARFQFREIGVIPPGRWMQRIITKLNEVMPKYKQIYQALADGANVLNAGNEYHKRRDVYSTFPQTALAGRDQDYASSGTDLEYETLRDMGLLDASERMPEYNDVDVLVLNELEHLFLAIRSTDIPWM